MKFDCGPTDQERLEMRYNWRRWFAWYPVRVGSHDCRWLEFVETRDDNIFLDKKYNIYRRYLWDSRNWIYKALDKHE